MRIVSQPKKSRMPRASGFSARSLDWHKEWILNKGGYVELKCGCVQDVNLPSCISILAVKPEILCDNNHGFQFIKKAISFRRMLEIRYHMKFPTLPFDPPY